MYLCRYLSASLAFYACFSWLFFTLFVSVMFKCYCWGCEKVRVWVWCGGHDERRGGLLNGGLNKINNSPPFDTLYPLLWHIQSLLLSSSVCSLLFTLDSAAVFYGFFIDSYNLYYWRVSTVGLAVSLMRQEAVKLGRLLDGKQFEL